MPYYMTKIFEFDAAHYLPNYDGKCSRVHGHRFRLEVTLGGTADVDTGMLRDFSLVKSEIDAEIIQHLDHQMLNDLLVNPTAEELLSKSIVPKLLDIYDEQPVFLSKVVLWETPTSCITWELRR